jgi:hypothetical protein
MDSFGLFLHEKNGQTTHFLLHDEQTVKGSKKIAWAPGSVFSLKWQHMYRYTYIFFCGHFNQYIYTWKMELTEIGNGKLPLVF